MEGLYLKNCLIEDCKITGCKLPNSSLKEVRCKQSAFQYCNFNESKFDKVILDQSKMTACEISSCKISSFLLDTADLSGSNFFKTFLKGVDLTNTDIGAIEISRDLSELRGATINIRQAAQLIRHFGIQVAVF